MQYARESPYPEAGYVQPSQPPPASHPPAMQHAPNYGYGGGSGFAPPQGQPPSNQYGGGGGGYEPQGQQQYGGGGYAPPQQQGQYGGGGQAQQYYHEAQQPAGQHKYNAPPPPQQQQQVGLEGKFDDAAKPKWNDLIFALLFLAQLGAFIAIAVISLRALPASEDGGGLGNSNGSSVTLNASMAWLLSIICGAGLAFSVLLLILVRAFTKVILEISLFLAVAMSVAYAVYLWIQRYWSGAIIFTVFAVLSLLAYPGMRRRIPLSKQLLIFVLAIAKAHPSVYVIALAGTVLVTLYSVFWSISVVAIYQKWDPSAEGSGTSGGQSSSGALIGLMVFAVFNYYVRPSLSSCALDELVEQH